MIGFLVGLALGGLLGVLVMAVLNVTRFANDVADLEELADLRKRFAACQIAVREQQERADTYYALFARGRGRTPR
jgi:uncharacterized membrane protein (DUF106 family)